MSRVAGAVIGLAVLGALSVVVIWKPWASNAGPPGQPRQGFDPDRALAYLDTVCKLGPRISGSDGMLRQQELLKKHFDALGGQVTLQKFTPAIPRPSRLQTMEMEKARRATGRPFEMANLIVTWHPDRPRRVILCCHYDTRPLADQEPDRRRWTEPFVSANDGGSGVAFLMEMAHHIKNLPPKVGVDFVIFDGEEFVFERSDTYFFGSEHFARDYQKQPPRHRYAAGVLLDMIAGKNPRFPIERNSWFQAGALVEEIWGIAAELRCGAFTPVEGYEVQDDHLALNRVGIPTVDIIDFDYPHWHRLSDVPASCGPDGLEQVARVLTIWLQRVK